LRTDLEKGESQKGQMFRRGKVSTGARAREGLKGHREGAHECYSDSFGCRSLSEGRGVDPFTLCS